MSSDFLSTLSRRAEESPDKIAVCWMESLDSTASDDATRSSVLDEARRVGAAMRKLAKRGDRILLTMRPGIDFTYALIGAMWAEAVPVPIVPPGPAQLAACQAIVDDCRPVAAWASNAADAAAIEGALGIPARHGSDDAEGIGPPALDSSSIAFLQYTSGSTGRPKGVVVTHGNLMVNLRALTEVFGCDERSRILSWLPMYHDMGLVGNLLYPLYQGALVFCTEPSKFVANPVGWLTAIAQHNIDTSGGPNFAYSLVLQAIRKLGLPPTPIDLSGWRTAYCGAEPIDPVVLRRFADVLASAGFRASSLVTCYGLAEATLLVTAGRMGSDITTLRRGSVELVSSGRPIATELGIFDRDSSQPMPHGDVGEIWLRGPSISGRYWRAPRDVTPRQGWLRTGDLGFVHEGELYVCGRAKDTIIIRGRNLYPHDVERTAERVISAVRPGHVIALQEVADKVTVVAEERAEGAVGAADAARLAAEIAMAHGASLHRLVIAGLNVVPKTTSGKLRRAECGEMLRAAALGPVRALEPAVTAARPDGELGLPELRRVALVLEELPRLDDYDARLTSSGLDSLGAMRLASMFQRAGYGQVDARKLLDGMTLRNLLALTTSVVPAQEHARADGPDQADGAGARLSVTQESLAFLQMLSPSSAAYNIAFAFELMDTGLAERFEAALRIAVGGDAGLASTIVATSQGYARRSASLPELQAAISPRHEEVGPGDLPAWLTRQAEEPFAFDGRPLVRVRTATVGERRIYLFVAHHVVTDLWSLTHLLERVSQLVDGAGEAPGEVGQVAYDVYVREQMRYLSSAAASARDDQLRERFDKASPLALGVAHGHVPAPVGRALELRRLPASFAIKLSQWDPVALTASVWGLCLSRFTAGRAVALGMPIAGRPDARFEHVQGLCTNTLPLLVCPDWTQGVREWAGGVRRQILDGLDHQLYPFSRAVRACRPERVPGRMPLVECLFTYHQALSGRIGALPAAATGSRGVDVTCGGVTVRAIPIERSSTRYDLDMVLAPVADGLEIELAYNPGRVSGDVASSMADTYVAMLGAALSGAEVVRDVCVLPDEHRAVARRFGVGASSPAAGDFFGLLSANVREHAKLPAIHSSGSSWTYGQLDRRVNDLARQLSLAPPARSVRASSSGTAPVAADGTRPLVALLLSDPCDFAIGLLGSWRAGLGVLPLPSEYPDRRLQLMIEDGLPCLLLAGPAQLERAHQIGRGTRTVVISARRAQPDGPEDELPIPGGGFVAYRLYTSGSTGLPKPVDIRLEQLYPLLAWSLGNLGAGRETRLAQTLSLGFDFGLQEIFTTFALGGCLVVPDERDRKSARSYAEFLSREDVNTLFTTPSFADLLSAAGHRLPGMRCVLVGGEVLRGTTVAALRRILSADCRILNGYGPTEVTVNCLMHADDGFVDAAGVVPAGAASGSSRVCVADERGIPVPLLAHGELLVAGAGIADSYQEQRRLPEVVELCELAEADAVYATGDIAYLDRTHGFTVLGRLDTQRKIGGFRVDLREIEVVISELLPQHQVLVRVVGDPARVAAFMCGTVTDLTVLQRDLAERLPPSAVPSQFILLGEPPLTANGKLDEDALRSRATSAMRLPVEPGADRDRVAALICSAWAGALGRELAETVNVFDEGAHSLAVATVHVELCAALAIDFPMLDLFEHPRPADLADVLCSRRSKKEGQSHDRR